MRRLGMMANKRQVNIIQVQVLDSKRNKLKKGEMNQIVITEREAYGRRGRRGWRKPGFSCSYAHEGYSCEMPPMPPAPPVSLPSFYVDHYCPVRMSSVFLC